MDKTIDIIASNLEGDEDAKPMIKLGEDVFHEKYVLKEGSTLTVVG